MENTADNNNPIPAPVDEPAPVEQPITTAALEEVDPKHQQNLKLVEEFQYLLEKSQQLFAGLRDLPPTGRNWQPYFQRTFEVYTKLWKFQQQHRVILENKDYYGLKRSEIGEAASKIGQLYYHYYLRTSETNYLFESFIFYEAIRERQYFKEPVDAKNLPLTIKKLRYYARFIVVCLLLNKNDMIKKLMDELTLLVEEYTREFKPTDAAEWNVVLSEISTFLEAEKKLTPVDSNGNLLPVSSRVQIERSAKFDKDGTPKMKLQESILVGNFQNQIKFSELTLDMYRMLQSLEREPSSQAKPAEGEKKEEGTEEAEKSMTRRSNPHKYLLYRPTFAQLMLYIATAFKDIGDNSALLIYLSADGAKRILKPEESENSPYSGGIATAVNMVRKPVTEGGNPGTSTPVNQTSADLSSLIHCLHPNDIIPFTRKPLFLIVDSTNSTCFKNLPKIFPAPLVCLMGPTEYPSAIKDTTQIGSLFTLFIHAPIKAFAFVSETTQMSNEVWTKSVELIDGIEKAIIGVLDANMASLDKSFKRFLQDDFLRQFIVRFILCHSLLSCHVHFKDQKHFPTSQPQLPPSIICSPEIINLLKDLTTVADTALLYNFSEPTVFARASTTAAPLPPPVAASVHASRANVVAEAAADTRTNPGSVRGSVANVSAPPPTEGEPAAAAPVEEKPLEKAEETTAPAEPVEEKKAEEVA